MARRPFTEHPEFMRISKRVNEALNAIATEFGCAEALNNYEPACNRASDDVTKLILRAMKRP